MPSFFEDVNAVWDAYLAQLELYIRQDRNQPLQPYSVSRAFPVDFKNYPKFSNGLANREANLVTDFGATFGVQDRVATIEDRYRAFLISLSKLVNSHHMTPEEQAQQKELEESVDTARMELKNFEDKVETRWSNYKTVHHIPSDDKEPLARYRFEKDNDYDQEWVINRAVLASKATELWKFIASMTPSEEVVLNQALHFWNVLDRDLESFPPSTGYEHESDVNLQRWGQHHPQTISGNWEDFYGKDDIRRITIDQTQRRSATRSDSWNGSTGWNFGFVSIGGSANGSEEETHFQQKVTKVELSFARLEEIDIIRGPWFQPILFDTYGKKLKGWWGPSGLLPCYPVSAVLARGLTIKLSVDDTAHNTFKSHVGGKGGINIGPFTIGGGGGGDTTIDDYKEGHNEFTVKDHDGLARIVGVRVARPNFTTLPANDFATFVREQFAVLQKTR